MTKLTFDAIINFGAKGIRKVADQVDDIKDDLKQADRLSRNLSDTKTGKSAMGAADMDTPRYRQSRSIEGRRGGARNFSGLLGGESTGTLVGAYAELAANVFALTAAFGALSQAARVEQLTQGLEILGARGGIALKLTADNLRDVTDNAISTADAMRAVAQASSAGLGADEIERLGKVARGASLALGRDASESMDRLTRGAIKLEPELLDELGIMVRLDEAVKEYALQNNKAASALTLTERRQAFLNAVLDEGERKFGDINDQIASNPFDRLAASARDFATAFGGVVNNFLGPIANFVADNPFALVIPAIFLATKALKGLGFAAGLSGVAINRLFNTEIERFTDDLFESSNKMDELKVSIRELDIKNIDDLKDSFIEARIALEAKEGKMTSAQYSAYLYDKTITTLKARLKLFLLTLRAVAVQLAMMAVQMLAITALIAAATAAYKFFEKNVLGLTEELKEQRKVFKELGQAADETAKQITMMLEPGKRLEGEAFDAVLNTLKATNDELQNYIRLQQMAKQEEVAETGIGFVEQRVQTARGFNVEKTSIDEFQKQFASEIEAAGGLEKYLKEISLTGLGAPKYTAQLMSTKDLFSDIEDSLEEINGFKADEEKALVGNLKVITSILPLEERRALLQKFIGLSAQQQVDLFNQIVGESAEIEKRFASMADLTRDIEKNVKGFFPKETKNDLEDLAGNYNDLYNQITAESPDFLSSLDLRATADLFLNNADAIDKTVVALQAQGHQISSNTALEDQRLKVKSAETALDEAKKGTDQAAITAAQERLDTERGVLGQVVQQNSGYIKQLATLTLLESNRETFLQKQKKIVDLELKNATLAGKQNKYYIERLNTLQDIRYAATGADINFPKEATIEYRLQIANMELETAQEIAGIKKRSIELESALEAVKLTNSLAESRRKEQELAEGLDFYDRGDNRDIFDKNGILRSFDDFLKQIENKSQQGQQLAIQRYFSAATEQSLDLLQETVILQQDQAQLDVDRAQDAVDRLKAEKAGFSLTLRKLKTQKLELDNQQKITDAVSARIAALSGNVALEDQFAALLEKRRLPALNNEINLLNERIRQEKELRGRIDASDPDQAERLRIVDERINNLQTEQGVLIEQRNTINDINTSYANGLLAQQTALQNRAKELDLVKQLAGAQKNYNEAAADLSRSRIELGARREFRDLSAGEEQQIEAEAAQLRLQNAMIDRDMMIAEYALRRSNAELEHSLLMFRMGNEIQAERDKLEKKGLSRQEIDQRLGSEIAFLEQTESQFQSTMGLMDRAFRMQVQTADMSIQTMLNDFGHLLNVTLPSTLIGMADTLFGADGTLNPDALAVALENTITNAVNNMASPTNVPPKTPEELFQGRVQDRMGRMSQGYREEMGASMQGFTGAAREFYISEMRKPAVDPELIKEAAVNMQLLQMETEGWLNVMNTVNSSMENAFMAMIDGSKEMGQAFKDMAKEILLSLAQMIVKMLTFKLIQTGLSFIPGIGPGLSAGFAALTGMDGAAGGIMPYANGGIIKPRDGLEGVVKQPTYLVGEGRMNEAVVPLPNGRSIPVQMHGGDSSSQQNNVSVTVNMADGSTSTEGSGEQAQRMGQMIASAVQKELMAQKSPGGLLSKYG